MGFRFWNLRSTGFMKMGLLAQHPIIKGPPCGPEGAPSSQSSFIGSNHAELVYIRHIVRSIIVPRTSRVKPRTGKNSLDGTIA